MSDFRYIIEFMKASGDKEKMNSLLNEKRSVYSNMERDAMVVIRECANINIKIEEKEEKLNAKGCRTSWSKSKTSWMKSRTSWMKSRTD